MKKSIFNHLVKVDNKNIIYNTLSRKYYIYDKNDTDFEYIFNNINTSKYSLSQFEIMKDLITKGILVKDKVNEIEKFKFLEKDNMFQEKIYYLTIQPTLNCNFRCTYCYETHKETTIDDLTESKILKFVENKSKTLPKFHVTWFGGEPMMRFDTIKRLSKSIKEICTKNNCKYSEMIVTNGYLFDDNIINDLKDLSVERLQITIDGNKKSHDKQRPLLDGSQTYGKVSENIIKLVNNGFNITLRINVSEDNYNDIDEALDIIPVNKRSRVIISICNLFQAKEKLNLFNLYMKAIEKGYIYADTSNSLSNCKYSCKNALTIEPNGECSICSCISESGIKSGYINDSGNLILENEVDYYKIKNLLATDRDMCLNCTNLPMCMGGCAFARYKNPNYCSGKGAGGLTIDEKIKLHYYYDSLSMNL